VHVVASCESFLSRAAVIDFSPVVQFSISAVIILFVLALIYSEQINYDDDDDDGDDDDDDDDSAR